jgi:methionyl aminopeptidase
MATIIKTEEERDILREGGKRLGLILQLVAAKAVPGVTTKELDQLAFSLITKEGDKPAFLEYTPDGADRPYPATLCISVNNEVVHGIPGGRILKNGDIVGLDLGLAHRGLYVDSAVTVPVGEIDEVSKKLIEVTKTALNRAMNVVRPGARIGDIGEAIERYVKPEGFSIVKILGGHALGVLPHEEPHIPNYGKKGTGPILKEGMIIALEPIINEGSQKVVLDERDGYTFRTGDGKRSAHFEHTLLITEDGAEIVTLV